jgi:hypothetical protein
VGFDSSKIVNDQHVGGISSFIRGNSVVPEYRFGDFPDFLFLYVNSILFRNLKAFEHVRISPADCWAVSRYLGTVLPLWKHFTQELNQLNDLDSTISNIEIVKFDIDIFNILLDIIDLWRE